MRVNYIRVEMDSPLAPVQPAGEPGERLAEELRGFGLVGLLAFVVISLGNLVVVPLSAVLALLWARVSRTPWKELGFVRPPSWLRTVLFGVLTGVALKLLLKSMVMPLLGAPATTRAYHYLQANLDALPAMLYSLVVGAGFGEEAVYRGYLFERLGKIAGDSTKTKALIVILTALWFGLAHLSDQGLPGFEQATIVGLVLGAIRARSGQIWTAVFAHAAFDLTALAIIYWNLDTVVSTFIFK